MSPVGQENETELTMGFRKLCLDGQVSTKEHGRKGSRDFKIRQVFGVLCRGEHRKLMMLE